MLSVFFSVPVFLLLSVSLSLFCLCSVCLCESPSLSLFFSLSLSLSLCPCVCLCLSVSLSLSLGRYLSTVYKEYARSIAHHLANEVKKRGATRLHWDASYKEFKHLAKMA